MREGRGLAFFYSTFSSSIAAVPPASNDLPFIFNETTADYQRITIQGQLSYRVRDPRQLVELLFVVREPFRSQRTQGGLVAGRLRASQPLHVESLMPAGGVIFSDGVEANFLRFNAGSVATIGPGQEVARLVQPG